MLIKNKKNEIKYIIILSCFFLFLTWVELYLLQVSRNLSFSDTFFFLSLVNFNILVFLFLGFLIFKNFIKIFGDYSKTFGKSLKTKLISAFIFFSFIPTGIVAILSIFYLNNSFSKWFDYKITDALAKVVKVGDYYQNSIKRNNYKMAYIFERQLKYKLNSWKKLNKQKKSLLINKFTKSFKKQYFLDKITLHTNQDLKKLKKNNLNIKKVKSFLNGKNFSTISTTGSHTTIESFIPVTLKKDFVAISVGTLISTYFLTQSKDIDEVYKVLNKQSFIFTSSKMLYFSTLIIMVLVIIFMATWFGFYLAKRLTIPVELLSRASRKIAKGSVLNKKDLSLFGALDYKSTSREFEQLLKDFQFMAEEIRKSKAEALKVQRVEAWAEVARRMAHEVKNPLTPISLSAQRLSKLFSKTLDDQRFDKSIKMIIEHTNILKNLVNEFALFARLPRTNLKKHSIVDLIKDVILFYTESHPKVKFSLSTDLYNLDCLFDKEQINRVLINLIANSIESMVSVGNPEVNITVIEENKNINIKLSDNGPGFKPEMINRVFEPYITNKASGTGLGLAIVNKILKEHGGSVKIKNLSTNGAEVTLVFPIKT
ncbi:MAG: GHKL domain-containing protein [Bdellovibrionales bacterium]|nr:GHKL domain-containing protein [Bdellovibrionales bacterium]